MTRTKLAGTVLAALSIVTTQVQVAWAAPPSNDGIAGATEITVIPATLAVDVTEATASASEPNCQQSQHNVWFSYTPDSNEALRLSIPSTDFPIVVALFKQADAIYTRIRCEYYQGFEAEVEAGQTYLLMAGTYSNYSPGRATLKLERVAPPRNDVIATAKPVHDLPFSDRLNTLGATPSPNDPNCHGADHTVWYSVTPETGDKLVASTMGSGFDSVMGIYTGRPGALKEISCTDDTGKSNDVRRVFDPEAGKRYFVMVGSKNGHGILDFTLQPGLKVKTSLASGGEVHEITGLARVSGTVVCSGRARVRIVGELRQRHGAAVTTASFDTGWLRCSQKNRRWSAVLGDDEHAFTPGEAGLSIRAAAVAGKESDRTKASRLVSLDGCRCAWGN